MDILWMGLGISAVVAFVFYALASYWQRLLKSQSRAIRALFDRIEALEEMDDPRFRKMVGESVPSPLEQVYVFNFRVSERFWTETVGANNEQLRYIRENGKILGSVKIERWRSHIAVAVTELLPQSQSAGWLTRTVDIYPTKEAVSPVSLWELYAEPPANSRGSAPAPALELRLENESLILTARPAGPSLGIAGRVPSRVEETVIFEVSLDGDQLSPFRVSQDDADGDAQPASSKTDSWLAFYRGNDEQRGVDWQLCVRDLNRKAIWERWNIVEPWQTRRVS
ncbi:MAG: hypothetical protein ACYDDI_00840 [Candidatus Acidiferrales bacterium]